MIDKYRDRLWLRFRARHLSAVEYVQALLESEVLPYLPVSVHMAGMVLTARIHGWRGLVLRAAFWMLRKAGHEVVTLPNS